MITLNRITYPGECLDIVGQIVGPTRKNGEAMFFVIRDAMLSEDANGNDITYAYVEGVLHEDVGREPEEMKGIYSTIRADLIKAERGVDLRQLASLRFPPAFRKSYSIEDMLAGSV